LEDNQGWNRARRWRPGLLLLALLCGMSAARADTTNFVGDFREAFWTNSPQGAGSAAINASGTELVLAGPDAATAPSGSLDGMLYNNLGQGLLVGGTVEFTYSYDPGDAGSPSDANFRWLPPGGGAGDWLQKPLGQVIDGVITNGFYVTPSPLVAGTIFMFSLSTDTPVPPFGKPSTQLVVTDFVFRDVPEPGTAALLANGLLSFGAVSWWRSRRRASSRQ
jgi:hypothetical protein